jgi:hypothetical protein
MAQRALVDRLRKEKLTLLVEGGGELLFASDRLGLKPLRELVFEHPHLLDGADAALPTVGLAAAYLLIHAKVGRVFTKVMTYEARRAFDDVGIEYQAGSHARKLASDDPSASHDPQAKDAVTWQAFVEEFKRQVS